MSVATWMIPPPEVNIVSEPLDLLMYPWDQPMGRSAPFSTSWDWTSDRLLPPLVSNLAPYSTR